MVMLIETNFDPKLQSIIKKFKSSEQELVNTIDSSIKNSCLELNREAKLANPAKTGTSRRGWLAPTRIAPMIWYVRNIVGYTKFIRYGKKKPSKFVSPPKDITINAGDIFVGKDESQLKDSVIGKTIKRITESLEKRINLTIKGLLNEQ